MQQELVHVKYWSPAVNRQPRCAGEDSQSFCCLSHAESEIIRSTTFCEHVVWIDSCKVSWQTEGCNQRYEKILKNIAEIKIHIFHVFKISSYLSFQPSSDAHTLAKSIAPVYLKLCLNSWKRRQAITKENCARRHALKMTSILYGVIILGLWVSLHTTHSQTSDIYQDHRANYVKRKKNTWLNLNSGILSYDRKWQPKWKICRPFQNLRLAPGWPSITLYLCDKSL